MPLTSAPSAPPPAKWKSYRAQFAAIERARRYIYIENAYFDDDSILRALIRARQRGVDVRVVFPPENDSGVMQVSNSLVRATWCATAFASMPIRA